MENTRRELEQVKQSTATEINTLKSKGEESTRSLGRVQFALDEALDKIQDLESQSISINWKGIMEDIQKYWKNLIGFWTGFFMPGKKKKEDDL